MKPQRLGASIFGASVLCACATAVPVPEPVLKPSAAASCTSSVSMSAPVSLTPEAPVGKLEKVVAIDTAAPCWSGAPTGQATYAVFALPTSGDAASVTAGAVIEAKRVFAPSVFTVGQNGVVLRTFSRNDLMHRGRTLSVVFKPQPGETHVVVAADPDAIGQKMAFVAADPDSATAPAHLAGPVAANFPATLGVAYSWEGQVFARVYFADPAEAVH